MKDAHLKKTIKEILESCAFENLVVDREVHLNLSGDKDDNDNLVAEKEYDVVARFEYSGKTVLLLFECEDAKDAGGVKEQYRGYSFALSTIVAKPANVQVIKSKDNVIEGSDFRSIDVHRLCVAYDHRLGEQSYKVCVTEAKRHSFIPWNYAAVRYYQRISGILGRWTKFEIFKEFDLQLEEQLTFRINALLLKQKGKQLYVGAIHPGLLLKIAYVVRRASEKTHAYQRMLSKERIAVIGDFISSTAPQSFIPNAVIVVMDEQYQDQLSFNAAKRELTLPLAYCSAWMIDGQHRAYGFLNTAFEKWSPDHYKPFDLPVVIFPKLPDPLQTQTFININYYQKRIKTDLLCDLTTLTRDLANRLTWPSLIGAALNDSVGSPLKDRIKISELHEGRPIGLASLIQYGLLETLLGCKAKPLSYTGPLFRYAPFDPQSSFDSPSNQRAFKKQVGLLVRFLSGVRANTKSQNAQSDPWKNATDYSLLRPTGLNALFMVLARILQIHPDARLNLDEYLRPFSTVRFERDRVARKGGGWKGFRGLANAMIAKLNKGKSRKRKLSRYSKKAKV